MTLEEALAQAGKPPKLTLEQALANEQYTPPPDIAEPDGGLPADVKAMQPTNERKEFNKRLGQGSAMAIGAMLGGGLGTGTLAQLTGEMAGTYVGGRVSGVPKKEAAVGALAAGGGGLVGRGAAYGLTRLAGKASGLSPEAVKAGIRDPELLSKPSADAELQQAQRLAANTELQAGKTTGYHQVYKDKFLKPVESRRVDLREYANMLRAQISGDAHPASRAADRTLAAMADRLEGIGRDTGTQVTIDLNTVEPSGLPRSTDISTSGRVPSSTSTIPHDYLMGGVPGADLPPAPVVSGRVTSAYTPQELSGGPLPSSAINLPRAGKASSTLYSAKTPESMGGQAPTISLGELDAWIRSNLTDPLHGAYTKVSEAVLAEKLMAARAAMSETMYQRLGTGASSVQKLAANQISTREAVENTFGVGTPAKPSSKGADAIKSIRGKSGAAQKNRAVLAKYDSEYGTDFLAKAERLSMQQEWDSGMIEDAYAIDSILQPTRPGAVRGAARRFARGGARATKYIGPISAGATAFTQRMIGGKKKRPTAMESP